MSTGRDSNKPFGADDLQRDRHQAVAFSDSPFFTASSIVPTI